MIINYYNIYIKKQHVNAAVIDKQLTKCSLYIVVPYPLMLGVSPEKPIFVTDWFIFKYNY